ncbi:MAG: UTP--glucose-1-phosphate uridylyltransferase GalU [Gammaproteobacteria bacterium]|nr:UTP--glucose-1-phosphate uridylyltransferase GalU [Gammaproteobacteria bacterium]MBT6733965.1 UTP--glucose-1-phosphate uridylyltransferase GalU [Gammaproteobacteria bacterium]MBT7236111.1 UTP--glucose-1-phosphate uridylyltransferase GalU [Gammaproteobacteria bacterium]|tara:strand:- start:1405 stop:2274 length:870 start_codon:yes stop_codon:yes gene_type:complete
MKKIKKVVFPVAGLGTRFLPTTKASPKEMLPIVDKPLIQYAAEEAVASGIKELIFIIGRTKNVIMDHFDSAPELENELIAKNKKNLLKLVQKIVPKNIDCFFVRQNKPSGLGHAIHCAKNIVNNEPFAVILADDLIMSQKPCLKQLMDIHYEKESTVLALEKIKKSESNKYGIVEYHSKNKDLYRIKSIVEKPSPNTAKSNLAVVGRYIFTPEIFTKIEKVKPGNGKEIQITDAIADLMKNQSIHGHIFEGKRFDCGSKLGYLQATIEYALEHDELSRKFRNYLKKLKI